MENRLTVLVSRPKNSSIGELFSFPEELELRSSAALQKTREEFLFSEKFFAWLKRDADWIGSMKRDRRKSLSFHKFTQSISCKLQTSASSLTLAQTISSHTTQTLQRAFMQKDTPVTLLSLNFSHFNATYAFKPTKIFLLFHFCHQQFTITVTNFILSIVFNLGCHRVDFLPANTW